MPPRRSYDQYCSAARALDVVGDRWTLLIVRDLLAGPRRYTDLHAYVYEVTPRGRELLPVLQALGEWGQAELGEHRPTDAVRAHWFALPLLRLLEGEGLVEVRLEEGLFHLHAGAEKGPVYGDGPAPGEPDARLVLDTVTCTALARGELSLAHAVRDGRVAVSGEGTLAKALREEGEKARTERAF